MKASEHELWKDERAATLRERDRQREPSLGRLLFTAKPGHAPARTLRLECPLCRGPVFTMSDSDRELIDCTAPTCLATLVTRRALDGSVDLVITDHDEDEELRMLRACDSDGGAW